MCENRVGERTTIRHWGTNLDRQLAFASGPTCVPHHHPPIHQTRTHRRRMLIHPRPPWAWRRRLSRDATLLKCGRPTPWESGGSAKADRRHLHGRGEGQQSRGVMRKGGGVDGGSQSQQTGQQGQVRLQGDSSSDSPSHQSSVEHQGVEALVLNRSSRGRPLQPWSLFFVVSTQGRGAGFGTARSTGNKSSSSVALPWADCWCYVS